MKENTVILNKKLMLLQEDNSASDVCTKLPLLIKLKVTTSVIKCNTHVFKQLLQIGSCLHKYLPYDKYLSTQRKTLYIFSSNLHTDTKYQFC